MRTPVKKHIKVSLRNGQSETIEISEPISAGSWLAATRRDGGKFVVLNGTSHPKEDIVDATEVKARRGFTNMDGI